MSEIHIPAAGVARIEEAGKIGISIERVAVWTLVFTNAFFICYFCGRLFGVI